MMERREGGDVGATVPLRRAVGWTLVTLCAAAVLQLAVYRHGGHTALGDIPGRFFAWRLSPGALPYLDRRVEYPVVIGYLGYATAALFRSAGGFFLVNALLDAALAICMTGLLREPGGRRLWRWIVGTPLLLYAFHNWDLVAMVPAVFGLLAYRSDRFRLSGAALALGASAKVFPGLLLPPLVVMRWCQGDRRGAWRLAVWATITTVVLNAPVALSSAQGWWYPARFQGHRHATWGSLVSWVLRLPGLDRLASGDPARAANLVGALTLVAALVVISVLAVRRRLDPFAVAAAVTAAFMLTNKVYSPNYDLWIVPFFVLLPLTRRHWLTFCAADLAIYTLVFGRFHGLWDISTVETALPVFVAIRAVALVWLIRAAVRPDAAGARSARPVPAVSSS